MYEPTTGVQLLPAGYTLIGSCSLCKGPVVVVSMWHSSEDPTPHCTFCGATAIPKRTPIIPMEPRR